MRTTRKDSTQSKYTKSESNYRPASNILKRCENCKHFSSNTLNIASGHCSLVKGDISPLYTCNYFSSKGRSRT